MTAWKPSAGEKRYWVKAYTPGNRRQPLRYVVIDGKLWDEGKPAAVARFDIKQHGADVALHLANAMRDDLNAGIA